MNKLHIMEILQILVKPFYGTSLEIDLNERSSRASVKFNSFQFQINDYNININDHSICKYLFTNFKVLQLLISEINLEITQFENSNLNTCPPDILNLNQENLIILSISLIFSLGIHPLLSEGTITESDSIKSLKEKFKAEKTLNSWKNLENDQRSLILKKCCLFFNLIISNENQIEFLKRILISKYLNNLLALFLEVLNSPLISDYLKTNFNDDFTAINFNFNKICQSLNQCNIMRELIIHQTVKPISKNSKINPPLWFKKSCLLILRELIMNRFGLKALILALMPEGLGGEYQEHFVCNEIEFKKLNALAIIAADFPINENLQDYYKNISKQILTLLNVDEFKQFKINPKDKLLINVLMKMISIMYSKDVQLIDELIISKIFKPFEIAIKLKKQELTIIDDQAMCNFVTFLDKVFIANLEPNSPLVKIFYKYLDYFFKLYLFSQNGISFIKSMVENIILWIFNLLSPKDIVYYLYSCFFGPYNQLHYIKDYHVDSDSFKLEDIIFMDANLKYANTSSGLIELILESSNEIDRNYYCSSWAINILLNFISSLKNKDEIAIDFIILLLEKLTRVVNNDIMEDSNIVNIRIETLQNSFNDFERKLFLFNILAGLSEKFEEITTENRSKIIDLAKLNLERGVSILNSTSEELTEIFMSETLTLAMGLLTAVFADRTKIKEQDWVKAGSLLPLLNQLSEKHELDEVREMALDLKIALATHGIFKPEKKNKFSFDKTDVARNIEKEDAIICSDINSSEQLLMKDISCLAKSNKEYTNSCDAKADISIKSKKVLIEEIGSVEFVNTSTNGFLNTSDNKDEKGLNSDKISGNKNIFNENPDNKDLSLKTDGIEICKTTLFKTEQFKEIFELLSDPSIPARGHGLIMLRKQIESCNPNIKDFESFYEIARMNLSHTDSYIYLNAILVISALGNICPNVVVERIAKEYGNGILKDEVQLKLGEVLVKIVDQLGELVPKYSVILVSSVLSCIKKNDGIVKASGVVNLGQICYYLHFSLGTIIYEVLDCVESLIKYNKHVETRRAAVHFTTQLLRGISQDAFQVLGDKLLDLYRILKFCRSTDEDEIVQLHVQLSIQELDIIIKKWLTPNQSLEKQLFVLDCPANNFTF